MNRRIWIQLLILFCLTAALGFSQVVGNGTSPGVEGALKWFAKMLLGAFGWISLIALTWHTIEWALDRGTGHLGPIAKWAICSGFGFSAYYIVAQLQAASMAQIQ